MIRTVSELIEQLKALPGNAALVTYNVTTFHAANVKEIKYIKKTNMLSIDVVEK